MSHPSLDDLRTRRDALGPWGHSYELAPGLWTRDDEPYLNWRVARFAELLTERGIELDGVRILDLACLDGLFCVEYAKAGAYTHGVDIRPDNIARARFGAEANGLGGVSLEIDDVLHLSPQKQGEFEVVLCCGLFYHLTAEDCLKLLRIMREVTRGVCLLDTHISFADYVLEGGYPLGPLVTTKVDGVEHQGRHYAEFDEATPMDVRMAMPSSSVHNASSFWFTRPSLYQACKHTGFTVEAEIFGNPAVPVEQQSRPVFVLR